MTKEELERIKQAYYSGLKVQIWFNGHWEKFDARDYSMYSDPFSENRLYRIVGSAYADIAEKRIAELEKENAELKAQFWGAKPTCNNCGHCLCENYQTQRKSEPCSLWRSHRDILTKAKEIIENIIRVTWGEGWNYSLDWKVKAEQFLNSEEVSE